MKNHASQLSLRLTDLINKLKKPLNKDSRITIITIVTVDVHSKDVIGNLIGQQVTSQNDLAWITNLRFFMERENSKDKSRVACVRHLDW